MSELQKLPNIGKELALKLENTGIKTIQEFKNTGSEQTFLRIAAIDKTACINMLYALEGAIQGIRWHGLPPERKIELRIFYSQV